MSQASSSELWHIVNQVHCEVQFKGAGLKFLASVTSRAERILKDAGKRGCRILVFSKAL